MYAILKPYIMDKPKENRGGKREGAGRPRKASSIKRENQVVDRKLMTHAAMGWEVLGDSYPDLMRAAIKTALGDETHIPNVTMLKALLELMVKVAGPEPEQSDSAIKKLVDRFIDRANEDRNSNEQVVDGDHRGLPFSPESGGRTGTPPDPTIPGVDPRFQFSFPK